MIQNYTQRLIYSFSDNKASSCVPNALIQKAFCNIPVEKLMMRPDIKIWGLDYLTEDIKNHFEGRIENYFAQVIFLFKTHTVLDNDVTADSQVGGGGSYEYVDAQFKVSRAAAAAHRATLASLRSYGSVIGQRTSFNLENSSTDWLPLVVNQVDSDLDRHLRMQALDLLRLAANGAISPEKTLYEFLGRARYLLQTMQKDNVYKVQVIQLYLEVTEDYIEQIEQDENIFRNLVGYSYSKEPLDDLFLSVQRMMHRRHTAELKMLWMDPKMEAGLPSFYSDRQVCFEVDYLFQSNDVKSSIFNYLDRLQMESEFYEDMTGLYNNKVPVRLLNIYFTMTHVLGRIPFCHSVVYRVMARFIKVQIAQGFQFID